MDTNNPGLQQTGPEQSTASNASEIAPRTNQPRHMVFVEAGKEIIEKFVVETYSGAQVGSGVVAKLSKRYPIIKGLIVKAMSGGDPLKEGMVEQAIHMTGIITGVILVPVGKTLQQAFAKNAKSFKPPSLQHNRTKNRRSFMKQNYKRLH